LRSGKLVQGELRMLKNTCYFGSIQVGKEQIIVSGSLALNRAIDGDEVVVERLDSIQIEAYQAATAKKMRHGIGNPKKSVSEAEAMEQAFEVGKSSDFSGETKGRVVSVVKRNFRQLCGTIAPLGEALPRGLESLGEGDRVFYPSDKRFPLMVVKPPDDEDEDFEGKRVVVRVNIWDKFSEFPRGKWEKTLGVCGDIEVETQMILMEHNIDNQPFSSEALACLPPDDYTPSPEELEGRRDLRDVLAFSIDPPGCEDIDDVLSCERLPNGNFRVGVHIADVSHFVHPDTPLDLEGAARCTSVYLVDRRIDMLPKLLTTDICSLHSGGDRLTFSCLVEITPEAKIVSEEFTKAVIHSKASLAYSEAQQYLDGERDDNPDIAQAIQDLNSLAVQLRAARVDQGAVELASEELSFQLDSETNLPTNLFKYVSYSTNKLIEEFMLLANQAAARRISKEYRHLSVLRNHPPPKEDFMEDLVDLLKCHGVDEFDYSSNKQLAASLDRIEKPGDPFFNKLVRVMTTRCMNEATYICTGLVEPNEYKHFGLAMDRYTHFTSPIRRYADIMVHRFLAASLEIQPLNDALRDKDAIGAQVERLNFKNRMARWADFASVELHLFLYFLSKGPMVLEGVVMRIKPLGVSIAIEEYGAEGVAELPEQDWLILQERQAAYGRPLSPYEGVKISIFDRVIVKVEANQEDGRSRSLKFTFVEFPESGKKAGASEAAATEDEEGESSGEGAEESSSDAADVGRQMSQKELAA